MITTLTGKRARLWAAALVTLSLFALALSGCAKAPKPAALPSPPPVKANQTAAPTPASWKTIQAAVINAVASDSYRQGEKYLTATDLPSDITSEEGQVFMQRCAVDLARSITLEQYEQMTPDHRLPYTALTAEQKALLDKMLKAFPGLLMGGKVQDSFLSFSVPIMRGPDANRHLLIGWATKTEKGYGGPAFMIN